MEDYLQDALDVVDDCGGRESKNRAEAVIDMKFAAGDQWDADWMGASARSRMKLPMVTVNQLPQYLNQIKNDIRQNRPAIKARPVDNKGDVRLADVFEGLMRHAQHVGKAETARDVAAEHAITHGLGWYRVRMDYIDPLSFDKDFIYQGMVEPHNVYHDDFREFDGSDIKRIVICSDVDRAELTKEYGRDADVSFRKDGASSDDKCVTIAEYYCLKTRPDTLLQLVDGTVILESDAKERYARQEVLAEIYRERPTDVPYVMWQKLNGDGALDERELPGASIPVFPVIGNCARIENNIYRFGLIRMARDPQRYYNWLKSAELEYLQNAPKAPWVGDARVFAPYKEFWQNANTVNYSYLPIAGEDDEGRPLPQPVRMPPASFPSGFGQAGLVATDDVKKAVAMYSAAIGARGNATSGRQELAQQREADTGNFHYADNLAKTVAHEGKLLLRWIQAEYGKRQVARIIGIDEKPSAIRLTQVLPNAVTEAQTEQGVESVYNLGVGTYDVAVSVGPSYTTKRLEAAAMMSDMTRADPTLMQKAGDIIVRNYDIPGSDELADRLKAFLPPQIVQQEQQKEGAAAGQQAQQMAAMLQQQVAQAQAQIEQRAQVLEQVGAEMEKRDAAMVEEAAKLDVQRKELAHVMELLQERQRVAELHIQLTALRNANVVKQAAEEASAANDANIAQVEKAAEVMEEARERIAGETDKLVAAKHVLGLQSQVEELKLRSVAHQLDMRAASVPAGPISVVGGAQPVREEGERKDDDLNAQDVFEIKTALSALMQVQASKPSMEEIKSFIEGETSRMRDEIERAIVDAQTVKVDPIYDDNGNVIGGEATDAKGRKRSLELSNMEE